MLRRLACVRVRPCLAPRQAWSPRLRTYAYPPEGVFQNQPNDPNKPTLSRAPIVPPPASDNQPVAYPGSVPSLDFASPPYPQAPDYQLPSPPLGRTPRSFGSIWNWIRLPFRILAVFVITAAGTLTYSYVQDLALTFCAVPFEPNSPEDLAQLQALQEEFEELPLVQILRSYKIIKDDEVQRRFTEWDAYQGIRHDSREQRLTTGPLQGSGGIGAQKIFYDQLSGAVLCFVNFGEGTSGMTNLVHGGLITTLFDETLGRCAFRQTEHRTGVTAKLNVTFTDKTEVGQWYVIIACPSPDTPSTANKMFVSGSLFCTSIDHELEPDSSITNSVPHLAKIRGTRTGDPVLVGSKRVESFWQKPPKENQTRSLRQKNGSPLLRPQYDVEDYPFHYHALADALFVVPKGIELTPIKEDF